MVLQLTRPGLKPISLRKELDIVVIDHSASPNNDKNIKGIFKSKVLD